MNKHLLVVALGLSLVTIGGTNLSAASPYSEDEFPTVRRTAPTDNLLPPVTINGFTFTIDQIHGTLLKLTHPNLGTILETSREKGSLFTVSYPIAGYYNHNQLEPRNTALFNYELPDQNAEHALILVWGVFPTGVDGFGTLKSTVTVVVHIKAVPNSTTAIMMKAVVLNNHTNSVYQVLFPDLNGIRPFGLGSKPKRDMVVMPSVFPSGIGYRPFDEPITEPDRSPGYAVSYWKRFDFLRGSEKRTIFQPCIGNLLVMREDPNETLPNELKAEEVMISRDQTEPDSMRLVWRRPTAILHLPADGDQNGDDPQVLDEGQTPWVILGVSINSVSGCQ